MNVIEVNNIYKKINKQIILDNISFSIKEGEIIGLIGPSGAGKTSLIKALLGIEKIDSGKITLYNKQVPNRQLLQRIGYMAQADALYNYLNAQENLEFFGNIYGLKKDILTKRIEYIAKVTDLSAELKKKVGNYSGGMKRRLSFGLALIQNPDLLILDEPTVGLDPILRVNIWEELYQLKKTGKTIIITTHVMDEVNRCDRILLIREGRIIADGTPKELIDNYQTNNIEEVFILLGGQENENNCDS